MFGLRKGVSPNIEKPHQPFPAITKPERPAPKPKPKI